MVKKGGISGCNGRGKGGRLKRGEVSHFSRRVTSVEIRAFPPHKKVSEGGRKEKNQSTEKKKRKHTDVNL